MIIEEEKIYRVYSPNGKFIVEGDAERCSDKLGIDMMSFERAAKGSNKGSIISTGFTMLRTKTAP